MKNKKEFELLSNLKYEINTEVTKDSVIKIRDTFLNSIQTQILDTKEKEVIKALEFLGWRKDKWQEEFEDKIVEQGREGIDFMNEDLAYLVKKYLGEENDDYDCHHTPDLKIKCKDGAILIERIDKC